MTTSQTVGVLSRRPTILHLPPRATAGKTPEGDMRVDVGAPIPLAPGSPEHPVVTFVAAEEWERAKKHPIVKQWLTIGWVKEKAPDAEAPTEAPPPDDLLHLSGPAATALVETERSASVLGKWLVAEGRQPVKDAIAKRLKALK